MLEQHDLDKIKEALESRSVYLPALDERREYVVNAQLKKPKVHIAFAAIAGGKYMLDQEKSLIYKISIMTAAERWFFTYVYARINHDTNVAFIRNADLTASQSSSKVKAFKLLKAKGIMKRVKREHYMINPDEVIPLDTHAVVTEMWESI